MKVRNENKKYNHPAKKIQNQIFKLENESGHNLVQKQKKKIFLQ